MTYTQDNIIQNISHNTSHLSHVSTLSSINEKALRLKTVRDALVSAYYAGILELSENPAEEESIGLFRKHRSSDLNKLYGTEIFISG